MEKNILVMGAFKTGTHTVYNTIFNIMNEKTTVKRLHINEHVLNNDNYDIYIFTMRHNKNIMPSTYFQDIIEPIRYEPFGCDLKLNRKNFLSEYSNCDVNKRKEIILNTPITELYNFYKNVFMSYKVQPTMDDCKKIFEKIFNIKIEYEKKVQFFDEIYKNRKIKIIVLDIDYFEEYIKQIFEFIDIEYKNELIVHNFNIGKQKWYGDKYKEFLEYLEKNN